MLNGKLYIIPIVASLLFSYHVSAQNTSTGQEVKKADINFRELANYYKEHPLPLVRRMPIEEDEEGRPAHNAPNPSEVHLLKRKPAPANGSGYHEPMLPVSPAPNDSFLSTTSPDIYIPPDTHGAVDSQYCVTAINSNVHVQTRTGGEVVNVSLDGFWASVLPSGTGAFDPRTFYDPYYKRWIIVTDAVDQTSSGSMINSTILIAVSATNDPTGVWHQYAMPVDPTGASWLDFPNVGFNQKWVVVTGNMFPNTGSGVSGAVVYIFNYASMMAGSTLPTPTKISHSSSFAICPAVTYDVTEPNIFCLETWSSSQLNLWKISGPVGSPTMTSIGMPTSPVHWHGSGGGSDFGPQSVITRKIDLGDDRITSVIFRNKKLWCTHTVFLPNPGTVTHSSIMWWQIDTLANPLQIGLINDPSNVNFYAYSSIRVNKYDDALIGFGNFSNTMHPSGAYAWRLHTDPVDSMRPVHIFRHGQGTYYTTFGGGKNRWGDYSGTAIDPRNDEDFWTIQESSRNSGAGDSIANWETWWANVQICQKPQAPTLAFTGVIPCPGDTVSYIINPIPGATSYVWLLSGAGWTGSSTSTSITLTAGSGTDTLTVLAYNACGEGEALTLNVTPTVPPGVPTITTITPACVGSATATFSASASGLVTGYTWTVTGTGWSGTSGSSSFTPTVGTGPGTIICTAWNTCGNSPADTLVLTAAVVPVTSFSVATHSTVTGAGDMITFTGSAPAGSTYTWSFGGGTGVPGTGAGPQTVTWTTGGTKTVTLTVDNNGCNTTFSDTVHVRSIVGTPIINSPGNNLDIVPNPNDGSFDILFTRQINKPIGVKISDMQGRLVYANEFAGTIDNKLPITTDKLPGGIYAVSIYLDGAVITKKIVINK